MPGTAHASQQRRAPKSNPKHQGATGCRSLQGLFQYCQLAELQSILGGPEVTRGEGREGMWIRFLLAPYQYKGQAASKAFQVKDPSTLGPEKHPNQPPQQMLIEISSILAPPAVNQHCSKNSHPKDEADVAHSLGCRKAKNNNTQLPLLPQTAHNSRVKRRLRQKLNNRDFIAFPQRGLI